MKSTSYMYFCQQEFWQRYSNIELNKNDSHFNLAYWNMVVTPPPSPTSWHRAYHKNRSAVNCCKSRAISRDKILTSTKGHNSVIFWQVILTFRSGQYQCTCKFDQNSSIYSQDIELKWNSDVNQGQQLCNYLMKTDNKNVNVDLVNMEAHTNFKILSRNVVLVPTKGNNSVIINLAKMACTNLNLGLAKINAWLYYRWNQESLA